MLQIQSFRNLQIIYTMSSCLENSSSNQANEPSIRINQSAILKSFLVVLFFDYIPRNKTSCNHVRSQFHPAMLWWRGWGTAPEAFHFSLDTAMGHWRDRPWFGQLGRFSGAFNAGVQDRLVQNSCWS
jgi:hypothetical protein